MDFIILVTLHDLYADQTTIRRRSAALFADLSLGYDNTVFVGLTARQEWSSTFGVNKRTFFYPGANLSFVFTELKPLKGIANVLSFGKLHAALQQLLLLLQPILQLYYNKTILQMDSPMDLPFRILDKMGTELIPLIKILICNQKKPADQNLELNWNSLMTVWPLMEHTTIKQQNILLVRPVPYSSGHSALYDNAGEMVNKGIELELGLIPIRSKKFSWSIDANYAANKNEVTKLAEGVDQIEIEVGLVTQVFAKN